MKINCSVIFFLSKPFYIKNTRANTNNNNKIALNRIRSIPEKKEFLNNKSNV
jgi:hypothetical protein